MISARHTGSSPLARGLRPLVRIMPSEAGIIPARAGFTDRRPGQAGGHADHPRSRGVYAKHDGITPYHPGSSPLARGLPGVRTSYRERMRIIPARAGFTARPLDADGVLWIIPARAGFTTSPPPGPTPTWDHPRSRGVYAARRAVCAGASGSSPFARGLRGAPGGLRGGLGIIPVRAGFTSCPGGAEPRPGDHPRSRGVYRSPMRPTTRGTGSSPLARGLRARTACTNLGHLHGGSSPLARGLHDVDQGEHHVLRIIPARAGFTRAHRVHEPGPPARRIIPARAGFT